MFLDLEKHTLRIGNGSVWFLIKFCIEFFGLAMYKVFPFVFCIKYFEYNKRESIDKWLRESF